MLTNKSNSGYTLIETLIALSMLLIIAAPVLSGIFRNNLTIDSERMITGIGILEQEARRISANPQEMLPVKKKIINGKEWTIFAERSGTIIVQYHLFVSHNNKRYGEIYFLQREDNIKK